MARLVLNPGLEGSQAFDLQPGTYEIGRRPDNPICISDGSVSGSHCKLTITGDTCVLLDLNSTNGTFVEGQQITECRLQHGQRLRLGRVELQFEHEAAEAPATTPPAQAPGLRLQGATPTSAPAETSRPRLRIQTGAGARTADVDQTVVLRKEPPPLERPSPAGASNCKYHPRSPARWLCPKCGNSYCDLCVSSRASGHGTVHTCRRCGAECAPLQAARERATKPSFYKVLPGAFIYPFKEGVLALVAGSVIYALFSVGMEIMGGFFAIGMVIFFYGYFFSYLQNVIQATASGETSVEWPTPTDPIGDILVPFFQLLVCIAVSFGPAIGLLAWGAFAGNPVIVICGGVAILYGCFYFPMAFLAVAMFDSVGAVNPTLVVPSIGRVFGKYIIICIILAIVFGANQGLALLFKTLFPMPIVPNALASIFGLYFLLVEGRMLGLLYWTNSRKLGWFEKRQV